MASEWPRKDASCEECNKDYHGEYTMECKLVPIVPDYLRDEDQKDEE